MKGLKHHTFGAALDMENLDDDGNEYGKADFFRGVVHA